MMRRLLRRSADREFAVEVTIHKLNSIPVTHRMMFIHWRLASRNAGSPWNGFTDARPVEPNNTVTWNALVQFNARLASDSSDSSGQILSNTPLQLQLRSERRSRLRIGVPSYNPEGIVTVDLAEVATSVGSTINRNFLVQESKLNATLHLSIKLKQISGDTTFRTREIVSQSTGGSPAHSQGALITSKSVISTTNNNASISAPQLLITRGNSGLRNFGSINSSIALANGNNPGLTKSSSFQRQPNLTGYATSSTRSDLPPDLLGIEEVPGTLVDDDEEWYFVPDPHVVQWPVYEQLFYENIREKWPDWVVNSRRDPEKDAEALVASVCAEDGIRIPRRIDPEPSTTGSDSSILRKEITGKGIFDSR